MEEEDDRRSRLRAEAESLTASESDREELRQVQHDMHAPLPDESDEDIDALLDSIDPADLRDARHFRRIIAARKSIADAEQELRDAVAAAREAGDSWTVIAAALDTNQQKARARFGTEKERAEVSAEITEEINAAVDAGAFDQSGDEW